MPPRLNLLHGPRALAVRTRAPAREWIPAAQLGLSKTQTRSYADPKKDLPVAEVKKEGNQGSEMPHVSEEAASMAKITGGTGPDINQGTPVAEVVAGDKEAQEKLPQVMKDAIKSSKPSGSRSFSTMAVRKSSTRRAFSTSAVERQDLAANMVQSMDPAIIESGMTLMGMPDKVREKAVKPRHLHDRYPNIIDQLTGLLIRDGKKAVAQRVRRVSSLWICISNTITACRYRPSPSPHSTASSARLQTLDTWPSTTKPSPPKSNPIPYTRNRQRSPHPTHQATQRPSWWWSGTSSPNSIVSPTTSLGSHPLDSGRSIEEEEQRQW